MTPGDVDPMAPAIVFCNHPTRERRHLPAGLTDRIARDYGIPRNEIGVTYQLDHLIPLSIGGATTAANLWPQPMVEADAKDVCDQEVQILVCGGKIAADVAQKAMAEDWVKACQEMVGTP